MRFFTCLCGSKIIACCVIDGWDFEAEMEGWVRNKIRNWCEMYSLSFSVYRQFELGGSRVIQTR